MDIGQGRDVGEGTEADVPIKDHWAQAIVKNVAAVAVAFRGAGDQRYAARRTYLQLAPEARTESYLEVIDEVLYQSSALSRLTRNARMAVARQAHVVEFQPGEALCVRGEHQSVLLVIMSGEVEVVDGRWDDPAPPSPPWEHSHLGAGSSISSSNRQHDRHQHHPPHPPQYPQPQHPPPPAPSAPSRRLAEQLSLPSSSSHPYIAYGSIGSMSLSCIATPGLQLLQQQQQQSSYPCPHPHPQPPATPGHRPSSGIVSGQQLPLQLDSRHTPHPALQAHASIPRRHLNPSQSRSRVPLSRSHSRASSRSGRGGAGGGLAAGGGVPPWLDGFGVVGGGGGRLVLHRGDSLGAVDMGWLSRLPRSVVAAVLGELAAGPPITSRALLATRAEMTATGPGSGSAGSFSGPTGTAAAMTAAAPASGGGGAAFAGVARRWRAAVTLASGEEDGGAGLLSEEVLSGSGEREAALAEGDSGGGAGSIAATSGHGPAAAGRLGVGSRVSFGISSGGGGSGGEEGSSADPISRLRWPCTAVAVRGRVECAAIGLHELCAVLATEAHWDVEAMVESLEELPVFAALSGEELRQLVRVLRLHTFAGGTVVYKQGTVGNDLFIIRSGCVRLLKQVALDDHARSRLNRISAELTAVRDQTAAAAALLHSAAPLAPFGSSTGYSPFMAAAAVAAAAGGAAGAAGVGGGGLHSRASTPASMSGSGGSTSTSVSPGRVRQLSAGAGGGGGGGGGGGWTAGARFGPGPPPSPRGEGGLHSSMSALAAALGRTHGPNNGHSNSDQPNGPPNSAATPSRTVRTPSGGSTSGGAAPSAPPPPLPCYPRTRPGTCPGGPALSRLMPIPDCSPRGHGGSGFAVSAATAASSSKDQHNSGRSAPGVTDAPYRRRSNPLTTMSLLPSTPIAGGGGGGGGDGHNKSRWRKRASHVAADELLDRFGMVPRGIGEKAEAVYEEVIMPGLPGGGNPGGAASPLDSGEAPFSNGTSDSDGGGNGLPPVGGSSSRSPSSTQVSSTGGWAAAAAAPVGDGGGAAAAVPVWQARAPRQLSSGQQRIFVELGTLTAGQCFGEVRIDGVAVRTSSAVCDTRTEVLAISRNELAHRLGGRVFEYLWNQVPNEGPQACLDPAEEACACAHHLERNMQWTLFKQRLVADVLTQKEQRRRIALKCR